jgi:hypothetical protein
MLRKLSRECAGLLRKEIRLRIEGNGANALGKLSHSLVEVALAAHEEGPREMIDLLPALAPGIAIGFKLSPPRKIPFLNRLYHGLSAFPHDVPSSAAIYPNKDGNFRKISALRSGSQLPPQLSVILSALFDGREGITASMIHDEIVIAPLHDIPIMSEAFVCRQIDDRIASIHSAGSPSDKIAARPCISAIYRQYIEAGEEKASLFPSFVREKGNIVCDIIFDKETRRIVSGLAILPKEELRGLMAETDRLGRVQSQIAAAQARVNELKSLLGCPSDEPSP